MGEVEYPYVEVIDTELSGLLYTNKDGSRSLFTGNKWLPLPSEAKTKIGLFKSGTIRKLSEYIKHVEHSDDRYFGSPAGRIEESK